MQGLPLFPFSMSSSISETDTIAALATPPGAAGIGVIRMSGPRAPEILAKVFQGGRPVSQFESHKLYSGKFFDRDSNEILDEGLAVWMRAPRSYTGEEVVELQAHGGPLILNRLLEVLFRAGLRAAEPGEFTRRAFLNGKMDLLQAEAVGEMIHAKSAAALKNAQAQLSGRLSEEIQSMRERLLFLLARVEAAIDFPEEDIELMATSQTLAELGEVETILRQWLEKFQIGRMLREGVRLALVGRPNVGKSSLLNRLLGEDRAIVHDSPGTTRDVIEGWMDLKGMAFQVFDTAGIREGEGAVEREGIRRSQQVASSADLTLWILDASGPLKEEDRQIARSLRGPTLMVGNKVDLGPAVQNLPEGWERGFTAIRSEWLYVSAKTGEGFSELKDELLGAIGLGVLEERSHAYLNNARHLAALREGLSALERARQALTQGLAAECSAADLQSAVKSLEALLGRVNAEDVLDKIFSSFCIGK